MRSSWFKGQVQLGTYEGHVSVIYCYMTCNPQFRGLTQRLFTISLDSVLVGWFFGHTCSQQGDGVGDCSRGVGLFGAPAGRVPGTRRWGGHSC